MPVVSSETVASFHKTVTYSAACVCYCGRMNESFFSLPQRPSILGSFFKGAMSNAMSGAIMATIVSFITPLFAVAGTATFLGTLGATAPLMILATGLFGGIMGIKRAMFDAPYQANHQPGIIPIPVSGITAPSVSVPVVSADLAAEQDRPSKNWVAETGRDASAYNRIQQIIANGAMSDKDRASAILAAREASTAETARSA